MHSYFPQSHFQSRLRERICEASCEEWSPFPPARLILMALVADRINFPHVVVSFTLVRPQWSRVGKGGSTMFQQLRDEVIDVAAAIDIAATPREVWALIKPAETQQLPVITCRLYG